MSNFPPPDAMVSPSTARNRSPILEVLRGRLPDSGVVLEIASGSGEHAVYNAAALPDLQWQPTDQNPDALASIAAWRDYVALPNLLPPMRIDAADPDGWPTDRVIAVVNINMVHISPWSATQGLMMGAGRVLQADGILFMYGPFFESNVIPAPSNTAFDMSLKSRNAAWGIRRLDDVMSLAAENGLELSERIGMPANNLVLVFRRT